MSKKKPPLAKSLPLQYCVAATIACLALALGRPRLDVTRHSGRAYADFAAFWPLYVQQHSAPLTKVLHIAGTCLAFASVVPTIGVGGLVRLCLGLTSGLALAMCAVDATAAYATGLPEAMVMVVLLVACTRMYTGMTVRRVILVLSSGYVLPWIAHFFVEKNRPATFKHPVFSLLGDFRLAGSVLTGQLALDATMP